MQIKFNGTVQSISKVEMVGKNGDWPKRSVVVGTSDGGKEQFYPVEFLGDQDIAKIKDVSVGDRVEIEAWLNGRKYSKNGEDRYFLGVKGANVNVTGRAVTSGGWD